MKADTECPMTLLFLYRKLEQPNDPEIIEQVWKELWNELHHQGDVGLASYLALPQLVRIGKSKELFDWNLLGLCSIIEQQRHLESNPTLPPEFRDYYTKGLEELKQFVLYNLSRDLDDTTYIVALATLATCTGRTKLGKAIMELEDSDIAEEFLQTVLMKIKRRANVKFLPPGSYQFILIHMSLTEASAQSKFSIYL